MKVNFCVDPKHAIKIWKKISFVTVGSNKAFAFFLLKFFLIFRDVVAPEIRHESVPYSLSSKTMTSGYFLFIYNFFICFCRQTPYASGPSDTPDEILKRIGKGQYDINSGQLSCVDHECFWKAFGRNIFFSTFCSSVARIWVLKKIRI